MYLNSNQVVIQSSAPICVSDNAIEISASTTRYRGSALQDVLLDAWVVSSVGLSYIEVEKMTITNKFLFPIYVNGLNAPEVSSMLRKLHVNCPAYIAPLSA